jgi:hypothetical protein
MKFTNFVYPHLPKDSIRLLDVSTPLPGKLVSTIRAIPLDNPPEFLALSYTWGTAPETKTFFYNERSAMNIAANLHEAIQTLFSQPISLDLPIWIDAICINQKDEEEKSVQVEKMGDVYRKAKRVVIWLGPAEEDSDLAMDWLERLSVTLPTIALPCQPSYLQTHGLPHRSHPLWLALGHLYRRKWFGRLWTFQEAVLAADILIVCGQKTVGGHALSIVASELNRLLLHSLCYGRQVVADHEDGFHAMQMVRDTKRNIADRGCASFTQLLLISDRKLCFEPRDKVYGMLGMSRRSFRDRIRISYSKSSEQDLLNPYLDCAKACIQEGTLPSILALVAGRLRAPGLPSWCPNLQSTQSGGIRQFGAHFRAGVSRKEAYRGLRARASSESDNLSVAGFRVDIVSEVVEGTLSWPAGQQMRGRVQRYVEWESRCLALAQKTLCVPPGTIPIEPIFALRGKTHQSSTGLREIDLHRQYSCFAYDMRQFARTEDYSLSTERRRIYNDWLRTLGNHCIGRRYFSTEKGRLGVGPPEIKKGDTISVFYGGDPVYILRPAELNSEEWFFVGDAFVHGLMELDETPQSTKGIDETFIIS